MNTEVFTLGILSIMIYVKYDIILFLYNFHDSVNTNLFILSILPVPSSFYGNFQKSFFLDNRLNKL